MFILHHTPPLENLRIKIHITTKYVKAVSNATARQSFLGNLDSFLRLRRNVVIISCVLPRVGLRRSSLCWRFEAIVILTHDGVDELPQLKADLVVRSDVHLLLSDVDAHVVDVLSHLRDVIADLNQHE